jgi:GH25 family lysozyme M1 (1,4-beta-N-acetylmuramidase)
MRFGLDLSGHQKGIDVRRLVEARSPVWAACKLTEAQGFVDRVSLEIVRELHALDVPCSGYHFAWANRDPVLQAKHFVKTESTLPILGSPVVDIEGVFDSKLGKIVDVPEVGAVAALRTYRRLVEEIEQGTGRAAVVYTSPGFIMSFFSALADSEDARALAERALWVAHYGVKVPLVPLFWKRVGRTYAGWQYDGGNIERSPEGMPIDANWIADPTSFGVPTGAGEVLATSDPRGEGTTVEEVLDLLVVEGALVNRPGGQETSSTD